MDNTLSKQLLLSILGLAILIVAIVGVSYAVLVEPNTAVNDKNIVYIDYDTDNEGIFLTNVLPMNDLEGMNMNSFLDFKVVSNISGNSSVNYEILLERVDGNDLVLGDNDVRIYLEKLIDGKYVPVDGFPSYFISSYVGDSDGSYGRSMVLYAGNFKNINTDTQEFTDNYRLKIWTDETTIIGSSARSFKSIVKINYKQDV